MTFEDRVGVRDVQNLMFVEEKSFGREMPFAQHDTLLIVSQLMPQVTDRVKYKRVRTARGNYIKARWWGYHVLRFSDSGPEDSDEVRWDDKPIALEMLPELLLFKINPLTLRSRSERRHHVQRTMNFLRLA